MGDAPNNQGIITQGQHGNNTIIQQSPARSVATVDAEKIAAFLRAANVKGRIEVMTDMMACPDCDGFAKQIEAILRTSPNLTIVPMRNGMSMRGFKGVAIGVRDINNIPASVQTVISAFDSIGGHLTAIVTPPDDPTCDGEFIVAGPNV
jgi:hypothetical protein